jgi:hypothetical protein
LFHVAVRFIVALIEAKRAEHGGLLLSEPAATDILNTLMAPMAYVALGYTKSGVLSAFKTAQ